MTHSRFAHILAAVGVLLAAACSSGRVKRDNAMALAAADGRVLEGCYDCLLQARELYERLTSAKYVKRDTLALRLFETNLLLALREKELQFDWTASLGRAKEVAASVPATIDAQRVLRIVDAVLPNGTGRGDDWPAAMRRERATIPPTVPGEISWLATASLRSPVRDYLALALDCSYDAKVLAPRRQAGAAARRPVLSPDAVPLVIYRTGICLTADTNMLAAVMAVVPRFPEAAFFAATTSAFAAEMDGGEGAAKLLDEAYQRFPKAPGVTFTSGWLASELGDCATAVRYFRETIAIDSTHEFGLLESTICLSRLREDSAVIATASRLIALRTLSTQQAYYWRAASRLRLKDLDSARSDIEAAKAIDRDGNTLTLGGVIENEQNDLVIAEQDLRAARALPRGDQNCIAAWTLGSVLDKVKRPVEAGDAFEAAQDCFDVKVAVIRSKITALLAQPSRNPEYKAKRLAGLASDSTEQRTRYYASAFNAAGQRANAGRFPRAIELLDIAARDPKLAESVAKLREAIGKAR